MKSEYEVELFRKYWRSMSKQEIFKFLKDWSAEN